MQHSINVFVNAGVEAGDSPSVPAPEGAPVFLPMDSSNVTVDMGGSVSLVCRVYSGLQARLQVANRQLLNSLTSLSYLIL